MCEYKLTLGGNKVRHKQKKHTVALAFQFLMKVENLCRLHRLYIIKMHVWTHEKRCPGSRPVFSRKFADCKYNTGSLWANESASDLIYNIGKH